VVKVASVSCLFGTLRPDVVVPIATRSSSGAISASGHTTPAVIPRKRSRRLRIPRTLFIGAALGWHQIVGGEFVAIATAGRR